MHSDLFRLSDRLREAAIRTTILTTGLLLLKHSSSIVGRLDDVIVSLDGPREVHDRIRGIPRAFDLLAGAVSAIHERKPGFPVAGRCTVQHENFLSLRETVRTAKTMGLQSISFLAADLTSEAFNRPQGWPAERQASVALNGEEVNLLENEIETMILELSEDPAYVLETPEKLRRIVYHFRAHLGMVKPVSPRCNAPWVSAVVEPDGTVRPCFFHKPIGNISHNSLREVLNGPNAIEFRKTLDISRNPTCRRCVCSLYVETEL
jgi:MoaA/NifB/PqqE/SkfB family radical SAM enzyme